MTNKTVDPNPLGGDIICINFTGVHAGLQRAIPLGAYFINNFLATFPRELQHLKLQFQHFQIGAKAANK